MPDTIAAIATGAGISAVGIVRLSGDDAINAAARIFRAKSGKKMKDIPDRQLVLGALVRADGLVTDICLCAVSRAPNSYTGEDTAELHCHGSPVVLAEVMRALAAIGVRQAGPGEFTKRAFLNGRMDLAEAEAVIDLIEAETSAAAANAAGQLGGAISRTIDSIYDRLVNISSHYFAVIDYPDEDIDDFQMKNYADELSEAETALSRLLATFSRGQVLKDGVKTAIIGRPNVGKSSLLNALVGFERAIVTETAGTTRDTVEEKVRIGSTLLRLVDTAGIRHAGDEIERLGIARSIDAASSAQLVLAVFDGSAPLTSDDEQIIATAIAAPNAIAVASKADLPQQIDATALSGKFEAIVHVSSKTGQGLDALGAAVGSLYGLDGSAPAGELLTNARQADAVSRALESLRAASAAMTSGVTPDAVLVELEASASALGEVTGKTIREDVTARIFERFCVGK